MATRTVSVTRVGIGADVAYDLSRTAVAQAAWVEDDLIGVTLDYLEGGDTGAQVVGILRANRLRIRAVCIDIGGPADILTEPLKRGRVRFEQLGTRESSLAQNRLLAELRKKERSAVRLPGADEALREAVRWARARHSRVGELVDRVKSGADVAPFIAAALAVYALRDAGEQRPPRIYTTTEEDVQRILREAKEK